MKQLPHITIVIVTLNNGRTIGECVRRIIKQNYPKRLIEYLSIDGGSADNTKLILAQNKFRIIESYIKKNAEAQRGIGLKYAKHNLIVSLDADNYLPHSNWLKQMVRPFMDDSSIVHAGTMHFTYMRESTIFNRYVSLFGVVDPVVYYVGKPDRLPYFKRRWSSGTVLRETSEYYIVKFTKESLPTVGCNGVVYRKDVLLKHAESDPLKFLHIDVFADLLDKGYDKYAIVKNDVIHDTADNLKMLMRKRKAFLFMYYLNLQKNLLKRRYLIYNSRRLKDNFKLLLFIIYTVSFAKPFIDSVRGYVYIRDRAWFVHPIVCWTYLIAYSLATIKKFLNV